MVCLDAMIKNHLYYNIVNKILYDKYVVYDIRVCTISNCNFYEFEIIDKFKCYSSIYNY